MNILNLNQLLKKNGLQEFPLDFAEQLNNKNLNNIDKTEIINVLKQIDSDDWNPLIYILIYNKMQKLDFKSNDIMDLINLYPKQLLQVDKDGWNPLMYILIYNKDQELEFKSKDILNLINLYPKQLLQIEIDGWNPLMFILSNNKYQELGLKRENIIDIIKLYPEQLLNINKEGWNPLMQILRFNKDNELGFNFETINTIYEEQINKEYSYIDNYNQKQTILFNEEYILMKIKDFNYDDLIYFYEFLDYRKTLLEKQKIINGLEINQNQNKKEKSKYKL